MFGQQKREVIERIDPEWTVGGDGVLVCPHGHRVEDDGKCPDGCTSPLRRAGLI